MAAKKKTEIGAAATVSVDGKVVFSVYTDSAEKLLDELIQFVYPEEEKKDGSEEDSNEED